MNYSTAVFLINDKVRAVQVSYEEPTKNPTVFKTLDPAMKVDDLVVVPTHTRHKMTVCKVIATDVDVDFDSKDQMSWIVSKVDRDTYDQILSQEEVAIASVRAAEVKKKREELRSNLAGLNEIKALPISSFGDNAASS